MLRQPADNSNPPILGRGTVGWPYKRWKVTAPVVCRDRPRVGPFTSRQRACASDGQMVETRLFPCYDHGSAGPAVAVVRDVVLSQLSPNRELLRRGTCSPCGPRHPPAIAGSRFPIASGIAWSGLFLSASPSAASKATRRQFGRHKGGHYQLMGRDAWLHPPVLWPNRMTGKQRPPAREPETT